MMFNENQKPLKKFSIAFCFVALAAMGIGYQNCGQVNDDFIESNDSTNIDSVNELGATSNIVKVTTGYFHSCALRSNGLVKCWGQNNFGQLGNGLTTNSNLPVVANIGSVVKTIDGGSNFTCALISDGTVKCWGQNDVGQLGNNTTINSLVPVAAIGINNAIDIAAGVMHACALLNNGTIKCWGDNYYGGLGSNVSNSLVPIQVVGINNAAGISVETGSCAVLSTGQVKCWGKNAYGQLGNGNNTDSNLPVFVSGISNARVVAVGSVHGCAILTTGQVKCWGDDSMGAIGNGEPMSGSFNTPVLISSLPATSKIVAGSQHTCIITSAGQPKCWGFGQQGQNGDGVLFSSAAAPVSVLNLVKPSQIDNDHFHACALVSGEVKCWGHNAYGQLGNGITGGNYATLVNVLNL